METEAPRQKKGKEKEHKKEKVVVKKEQATEVGLPSTINKAEATGSIDKGIEPVATETPEEYEPLGELLVEVSRVVIFIKKYPVVDHYIYGEVYVPTIYGNVMLFKREREKPQDVGPYGDELMLVGPQYPLQGYDRLTFVVDLWEDGKQVVQGYVDWPGMYSKQQAKLLNSPQCLALKGNEAFAEVHMVPYSNAILANVEFKLRKHSNKNNSSTHDIHGRIFASNSKNPDVETMLLDKKVDESIQVGNGDLIPLMRSMIAVPLNAFLRFDAHLPLISSSDLLSCEIMACKDYGVDVERISGEYGQIEVAITWESLWGHSLRTEELGSD